MEQIKFVIEKSARIDKLISALYEKMPEIETSRGVLVTESYKATEDLPIIRRRSAAFSHILKNIPIASVRICRGVNIFFIFNKLQNLFFVTENNH